MIDGTFNPIRIDFTKFLSIIHIVCFAEICNYKYSVFITPHVNMDPELRRILEKQHYKLSGEHSGVKLCHWMREKLLFGRPCYKEKFYGIPTHRCLQMTPTVNQCNQSCLFCWRYQGSSESKRPKWNEPENIYEGLIEGQRQLLSGYKGDQRTDQELWKEAQDPMQVAISLSGEPTLYPYLSDLIGLFKSKGATVFLVTNGTMPKAIEKLDDLPTQLYVTLAAPNKEVYKKLCIPDSISSWDRLMETLALLPSLNTRTVVRHTLVQDWNLGWEKEYAKLDLTAEPTFIEPKAYVFVGYSRTRMTIGNMPSHQTIRQFSERLSDLTGYPIVNEMDKSRVVLMAQKEGPTLISTAE